MKKLTDVSDIVDSSQNVDGYEKTLLKNLFEKLEANQSELFGKIEEKVEDSLRMLCPQENPREKNWRIYTALINQKDISTAKDNGFFEMIKADINKEKMKLSELNIYSADDPDIQKRGHVYGGVVFLDCRYSEIGDYKKDYYAKLHTESGETEVKYNLIPCNAYMECEKTLEQTALQYGITVPLIYSPMSRRAMLIKLDIDVRTAGKNSAAVIDFQYEKNKLDKVVLSDMTLVWNVETTGKERLPRPKDNVDKTVVPLFDSTYLIYSFDVNDDQYLFVQSNNTDVKRNGSRIYFGIDKEIDSEYAIETLNYQLFTVHHDNTYYAESCDRIFENKYNFEGFRKHRVRTKGDIFSLINCFDLKYEDVYFSEKHTAVHTYEKRHAYHYPKDDVLKSNSAVYVKIQPCGDMYFEDHVSYVFSYLNYYYPEFRWVGVY